MRERFGTELNPSGFPMESLIWIKEQSNDRPNFYSVKTLLNPNRKDWDDLYDWISIEEEGFALLDPEIQKAIMDKILIEIDSY